MSLIVRHPLDEKDLNGIFKLRYKVFCHEWDFEKPENHPDGIVTDGYDKNAIHLAVKDDSHKVIGAVMLILDSPEGYPVEKHCELDINIDDLPRQNLAEISRLVIHRNFRRRAEDTYIYGPDEDRRSIGSFAFQQHYPTQKTRYRRADDKFIPKRGVRRPNEMQSDRRRRHEVIIDLYKAVYQESKRRNLTHWYSVMTKGIVGLLNKFGFAFEAIGDPVDFHGIRTPYLANMEKMEKEMSTKNPEMYEEFTKNI